MNIRTDLVKKEKAIKLRKRGRSIRDIEKILGIPRSTLSGWLRDVKLSKKQKERLHKKWLAALVKARLKANEVNKTKRLERMKRFEENIKKFTSDILINKTLGEIIFAIFYLAEGTKGSGKVEIASANPEILTAFLKLFRYLYSPAESRLRCRLNLRYDQSEKN
jgi:predicted transcriptional regulator